MWFSSVLLLTSCCALLGTSTARAEPDDPPRMLFTDTDTDQHFAKDPTVVNFRGTYYLYYSAGPRSGARPDGRLRIGIATSDNLVDWVKVGELQWKDGAETKGFAAPGAIVLQDKVHLFYQSYGNGPLDAICHAWSEDGRNFTRNENPVFRPHRLDSEGKAWNSGRAIDANVIPHGDRLLMYWATRDPQHQIQIMGVAAAPLDSDFGPDAWTQLSTEGPVLAPELPWEKNCVEAAAMARHNGNFYMFYGGAYNHERQQIGVAWSPDGLNFTRMFVEAPFKPYGEPGTWNSYEVGHPFYFRDNDGREYLFYQGRAATGFRPDGSPSGTGPYHLSMSPLRWQAAPDGGPARPVLEPLR